MRLTLRTMLAYLDDILEPDDTEDIGKKIEESEFASNLVHRTRDSMRRLRLGVPAVFGRGLAEDPNSVAEYLDNTLSAERVGEFEKICLESDVHLAEVASCHQILTLVLGEPAEIDPRSRQRMYGLAAHVDAPPVQTDSLKPEVAARALATPPPTSRRVKPEVPEYLRESRSRFWPVAAMVAVAALVTLAGLVVLDPLEIRERLLAGGQAVEEPAAESTAAPPADTSTATAPAAPDQATADDAATAAPPPAENAAPSTDSEPAPPVDNPEAALPLPEGDAPGPAAEAATPEDPAAEPATPAADAAAPEPNAELPASEAATPDAEMPLEGDAAAAPSSENDAPSGAADDEPAPSLGRFTSKKEVLLRYDADSGQWLRLAAMSPLSKGDQLLSLPLFRPMLTLSTSLTMQAEGAAKVDLIGWSDAQSPVVSIEYGRWIMSTVGKADNSLVLKFGDQQIQLTFIDGDAQLALDVHRVLPAGADPEASPVELAVDLYATSGSLRVREGDKTLELTTPQHVALGTVSAAPAVEGEFPKWVSSEALTDLERSSMTKVEPLLPSEKPVDVALRELALSRQREVRALAIRSLATLGDFEACVDSLNDPQAKSFWPNAMEELRAAVARSPETAAKVRVTFEKRRSADAPHLFRMLWGYSVNDLKSGADRDLVDALDNASLDMRVMSFLNLLSIVGPGTHGYRPEDTVAKRQRAYNAWKEKRRQGKILPQASTAKPKAAAKGG